MSNVSCYLIIEINSKVNKQYKIDFEYNLIYESQNHIIIEPQKSNFDPMQISKDLSDYFNSIVYTSFIDEDYFSILSCYKDGYKVFLLHKDFNTPVITEEEISLAKSFFNGLDNDVISELIGYYSTLLLQENRYMSRSLLYSLLNINEDEIIHSDYFSKNNSNSEDMIKEAFSFELKNTGFIYTSTKLFDVDYSFLKKQDGFYTGLLIDRQGDCLYPRLLTNNSIDSLYSYTTPMKYNNETELKQIINTISTEFLSNGIEKINHTALLKFDFQEFFMSYIVPLFKKKEYILTTHNKYNYVNSKISFSKNDQTITIIHSPAFPCVTFKCKKGNRTYFANIDTSKYQSFQSFYKFQSQKEYLSIIDKLIMFID